MKLSIAAIVTATYALTGCTPTVTQKTAPEDPPQKWVADLSTEECLSKGDSTARLAPLAITAITKVADWALSAVVDKVQEAAEKDRIGFSQAFVDGSFLYHRAGSNPPRTASCIRIAHGTVLKRAPDGTSPENDWCKENASGVALCKDLLDGKLSAMQGLGKQLGISSPDFYAEIQMENQDNATATRGTVAYLYYPTVLKDASKGQRDLTITVSLTKAAADPNDSKAVSTIAVHAPSVSSGPELQVYPVSWSPIGWTTLPEVPSVALSNTAGGFGATTLKVSVVESNRESKVLQWLAKVLTKENKDKAIDKLKESYDEPSAAELQSLQATSLTKYAEAIEALGTYCTAQAAATASGTAADNRKASSSYAKFLVTGLAANAAHTAAGKAQPFKLGATNPAQPDASLCS